MAVDALARVGSVDHETTVLTLVILLGVAGASAVQVDVVFAAATRPM